MDEKKNPTRNERVSQIAETLGKLGYKIRELKFLVDDNEQDENTASQTGIPYLKLTLSL